MKNSSLLTYSTSVSYTYDSNGIRGTKKVNGIKSTYHYVGGQLRYETRGNLKFYYFYDASGNLSAIRYYPNGGTTFYMYYPLTNHKGDIIALYDANANLVASYEYDAWGKVLSVKNANGTDITSPTHIANLDPIRYRGYYYDTETGLYYLQSRYYDPQIGRFINPDGALNASGDLFGYNMFAYCENNSVNFLDPNGCDCICITQRVGPRHKCNTGFTPFIGECYSLVTNLTMSGLDSAAELVEHCVITGAKPNNIGLGLFLKQQNQSLNNINKYKTISAKISAYTLIITTTISVAENAYVNYSNGASMQKIAWDAAVDVSYLGCQAALCFITCIFISSFVTVPVLAPLIGVGISYLICYGMDKFYDDKINMIKSLVK